MNKVKNRKAIRGLAFRELKSSRLMSVVIILSIVLTCVLFTALATIGGSLMKGLQRQTMRQVGGDRMAGLKYVRQQDYEKIKSDPKTRDVVYRIIVGQAINEKLRKVSLEIDHAGDEKSAAATFCLPATGRLPQEINEIALSSLALEELGIPKELGNAVPLTILIDNEIIEYEFTLCGFWEGDSVSMAQIGWVSRAFADKYAPSPSADYYENPENSYAGYWQVEFNFPTGINIEKQTQALLKRLYKGGENTPQFGVNWAYSLSTVDSGTVAGILILALVIFFAGYLIIYNIFFINVSSNVRKYGLLKTLGMTPAQIRRLVEIQTRTYSLIGIPAGLLTGLLLGRVLFHFVIIILSQKLAADYQLNTTIVILICVVAALFTHLTVMASCQKPARMAGSVSPMEALRYNENSEKIKKEKKKTNRIHPFTIAKSNLLRSKKKTFIVMLSLTLSLILLNVMVTLMNGLDMNKYVKYMMVGDLQLTKDHTFSFGKASAKILPEQIREIKDAECVEECCSVYETDGEIRLSESGMEKAQRIFDNYPNAEKWENDIENGKFSESSQMYYYVDVRNLVKGALYHEKGMIHAEVYGIDPGLLSHLETEAGKIDAKNFATGNYCLVTTEFLGLDNASDTDDDFYAIGDKLTLLVGDVSKEYEVMALCDIPYSLSTMSYTGIYGHVLLPVTEWQKLTTERNALSAAIYAKEGRLDEARDLLLAITERTGSGILLQSKEEVIGEFKDFLNMLKMIGGSLAGILALIGILNFVNAMVTSIIARKKEFAMMQAIGMTGKQMRHTLIWEGIIYAAGTFLFSTAFGIAVSYVVLKSFEREVFYYSYHFTILPILISIPFLLIMAVIVPTVAYARISKESIVKRIRENEG